MKRSVEPSDGKLGKERGNNMPTTVHVAASIEGLRRLLGEPPFLAIARKNGGSAVDFVEGLRSATDAGQTFVSNCPSPLPNGKCPGH